MHLHIVVYRDISNKANIVDIANTDVLHCKPQCATFLLRL